MATILIVDDQPVNRGFLGHLLRSQGHEILEADDGSDALEVVTARHLDLIITDIVMPKMDGYEFVHRLRQIADLRTVPVVFYSGVYNAGEANALAKKHSVFRVLSNPCQPEQILKTVADALAPHVEVSRQRTSDNDFTSDHARLLTDKLQQKVGELDEANRRLGLLVELGQRLALIEDPLRLIDLYCQRGREILGTRYAAIGLLDERKAILDPFFLSSDGAITVPMARLPIRTGFLSNLFAEGTSLRVRNPTQDPRLVGLPAEHPSFRTLLGAVIASPTRVYGAIYFGDKLPRYEFSAQDERLATTLAAQLATAYENARRYDEIQRHARRLEQETAERRQAEQKLQEYSERLRLLSRELMTAQETERRHIAHELHDEVGQALTAVKINLYALRPAGGPPSPRVEESISMVERVVRQVRDLSLDLRPSMLDDLGLVAALRWYVERLGQRAGLATHFDGETAEGRRFSAEIETTCFRVAQEALTNVVRHAKASQIDVELRAETEEVQLLVRDDGAGFDVARARARAMQGGSLGLLGMQERVALRQGEIEIESTPGEGTEVHVRFRLPSREEGSEGR